TGFQVRQIRLSFLVTQASVLHVREQAQGEAFGGGMVLRRAALGTGGLDVLLAGLRGRLAFGGDFREIGLNEDLSSANAAMVPFHIGFVEDHAQHQALLRTSPSTRLLPTARRCCMRASMLARWRWPRPRRVGGCLPCGGSCFSRSACWRSRWACSASRCTS